MTHGTPVSTGQRIAAAAMAWDTAQRHCDALKTARHSIECDRVTSWDPDVEHAHTSKCPAPCWKTEEWEDGGAADPAVWCPRCLERQRLHRLTLAASRSAGAKRVALRRLCQRGESTS